MPRKIYFYNILLALFYTHLKIVYKFDDNYSKNYFNNPNLFKIISKNKM